MRFSLRFLSLLPLLLALAAPGAARAAGSAEPPSESLADRTLKQIVAREKTLLDARAKHAPGFDQANFDAQMNQVYHNYEALVRDNPDYVPGLVAYGLFLRQGGLPERADAEFRKADELDPNLPVVKNELGNYLAEQARTLEARTQFEAAVRLAPDVALYHYQLGTLLYEARDDFLKNGESRGRLDRLTQQAFLRAAQLAPDNVAFAYRYAESFYDLAAPDWPAALRAWQALEPRVDPGIARQVIRLQEANVLLKEDRFADARALLATVTEPKLAAQKEKLVAQLPEKRKE